MKERIVIRVLKYTIGVLVITVVTVLTNDKVKEYQNNKECQQFYEKMRENGISPITRGIHLEVLIDTIKKDTINDSN